MKCPKCGNILDNNTNSCTNCGTSILNNNNNKRKIDLLVIIPIAIIIVLIIAIVVIYILKEQPPKYNDNKMLDDLNIYVPKDFTLAYFLNGNYNEKKYKQYKAKEDSSIDCSFEITTVPDYDYEDIKYFLEKDIEYTNKEVYSGISTININGNEWFTSNIIGYGYEYYYAIIKNGRIYKISFHIHGENKDICIKAKDDVMNLSKFN